VLIGLVSIRKVIPIVVVCIVIVAFLVTFVSYQSTRTSYEAAPKAEDLLIQDVKINRRTHTLTGVVVENNSTTSLSVAQLNLIKVQGRIVLCKSDIEGTPVEIAPGEVKTIDFSCSKLDPEGADYEVVVITTSGALTSYIFPYPFEAGRPS
jgi:hypothetical protein